MMTADPDMLKVRALCARLAQPAWMPAPAAWVWQTSAGRPQGPALVLHAEHGAAMANLLWLALDLEVPPRIFDMTTNPLACLVLACASSARLAGTPLLDLAGLRTLEQFAALLPERSPVGNPLEATYPLLRALAQRRLRHA